MNTFIILIVKLIRRWRYYLKFLDPKKPIETCQEHLCDKCNVKQEIHCHFNSNQAKKFLLSVIPAMLVGLIGIYLFSPLLVLIWLIICFLYFGFIEIRVMCSHCPHYAETETKTLKCWANYGSPKLWKYRPGPMSITEKIVFILGGLLIAIYPLFLIILSQNYPILIVYLILTVVCFYYMRTYMCNHCINFACPANRVDKKIRDNFFDHNPQIRDAWKK